VLTDEFYRCYLSSPDSLFKEYDASQAVADLILAALQPDPYQRISITDFHTSFAAFDSFYCHLKTPSVSALSHEVDALWSHTATSIAVPVPMLRSAAPFSSPSYFTTPCLSTSDDDADMRDRKAPTRRQ
jgi:hypothetical protein